MAKAEAAPDSLRPVVALDIDGVLLTHVNKKLGDQVVHPEANWLTYNPHHGRWLKKVMERSDVYYISDRQGQSHQHIGKHLELPELDWIDSYSFKQQAESGRYTPRALAITALFGRRPVAWIDDEINEKDWQWYFHRDNEALKTFLIEPDPDYGLEAHQMSELLYWLEEANPDHNTICHI